MKSSGIWFAKFLSLLMLLCPRFLQIAIARFLAFLWWDIFRLRRLTIFRNLTIVFPDLSKAEKNRIAQRGLFWMGYHFLEFLKIPLLTQARLKRQAVFHGIENYEIAKLKQKGVLFLSLHLGSGDIATAMMSMAGLPCHLISKKFKQKMINDFWFGVRESKGTKFIDPHGRSTAFDILGALNRHEIVIFVLDQFMGKPYGIETIFFGRKTGTAYGLALFALKTGAPVLPVYTMTDEDGKQHIFFDPAIEVLDPEKNRDLQLLKMTTQYNQALEKIILRFPEQWMWVHRRWKKWE